MSSISQAHEQIQKVKELKKKRSKVQEASSWFLVLPQNVKHTDSELEKWADSPVASFVCPANSILRESQRKACIKLFSISLSDAFSHSMYDFNSIFNSISRWQDPACANATVCLNGAWHHKQFPFRRPHKYLSVSDYIKDSHMTLICQIMTA